MSDLSTTRPQLRRLHYKRLLRRGLFAFLLAALSLLGAAFIVTSFGAQTYHWRAFEIEVRIQPAARGETRLVFTPLGEVRAATHKTPLALEVSLRSVSFENLGRLIQHMPPRQDMEREFAAVARRSLTRFALREVVLGMLGALLGPLLLHVKRPGIWAASAALGGAFTGLLLYGTLRTYNPKAFEQPTYVGSLREARAVTTLVSSAFHSANALSDKLKVVAGNLNVLYGRIGDTAITPEDDSKTVRVLHISDIHNNTAAIDFVKELAQKFQVNFVVDTGDLSDYGSPVEAPLAREVGALRAPYLFVAGNHDSQTTIAAVRANPNAIILNGQPVVVDGLTVLGLPDPSSMRPGIGSVDTPLAALRDASGALAGDIARMPAPPDLVCVHNPLEEASLEGRVPVILCGHLHRAYINTVGETVICNAGTTGGAGLRYLDHREGVPLTAAILTFSRAPKPRLLWIDQVALDGALSEYSITRRTFAAAK
ncbi:phosphohydrolase [Capsulimonas corticalis]|uniref:Phosphohydrolase n=1 Tax=Capsulimonas corticalis TaxID=2219043 RepID=A0A402D3I2_9BACT|nr:metallophosphoesterase [Capsulimonas corticalis]BDI28585.1 phosphohydrolase [Capsulimonas corticalis]